MAAVLRYRLVLVGGAVLLLAGYALYRSQRQGAASTGVADRGLLTQGGEAGPAPKEEKEEKEEEAKKLDKKIGEEHGIHDVVAPEEGVLGNDQDKVERQDLQERVHHKPNENVDESVQKMVDFIGRERKFIQQPKRVPNDDSNNERLVYKSLKDKVARGEVLSEAEKKMYLQFYHQYGSRVQGGGNGFGLRRRMGTSPPIDPKDEGQRDFMADQRIYGAERRRLDAIMRKHQGPAGSNNNKGPINNAWIPVRRRQDYQDRQLVPQQDYQDRQDIPQQGYQDRRPVFRQDYQDRQDIPRQGYQDRRPVPRQDYQDRQGVPRQGYQDRQPVPQHDYEDKRHLLGHNEDLQAQPAWKEG